jgi:hypothetical protein
MTRAKFSDLLDAYEFCNFGDLMETQAFLSLERGTVHIVSGEMELDEEPPEDLESGPYLALPDKHELDLGAGLAIAFVEAQLPADFGTVVGYFKRPGAYVRFKGLLEQRGLLQAWFDQEKSETEARLRAWLEAQEIDVL